MQPPVVTAPHVTRVYGTAVPLLVLTFPEIVPFASAKLGYMNVEARMRRSVTTQMRFFRIRVNIRRDGVQHLPMNWGPNDEDSIDNRDRGRATVVGGLPLGAVRACQITSSAMTVGHARTSGRRMMPPSH